jgi:nitrate reductase delta subunit
MLDRTLKALSLILSYPSRELQDAMGEVGVVLGADTRIEPDTRAALQTLADGFATADLYGLQESYVMLFDRSRTLSLNLFEHVHGESRDRGSAMVSLIETYRMAGFEPTTSELPDHLPVLLEFLSTRPFAEVQEILADAAHIVDALKHVFRNTHHDAFCLSLRATHFCHWL